MKNLLRLLAWLREPKVEIRFHLFLFLPVQTFGVMFGLYTGNRILTWYAAGWAGWTIYILLRHWKEGRGA